MFALFSNTNRRFGNMPTVFQALISNTTGNDNTANGFNALSSNTTGYYNTANGFEALRRQHHRQREHGQRFSGAL